MQLAETELTIRAVLLSEVRQFVERAQFFPGVRRIALIGSLATHKDDPKDADVLVTVDDDADLTHLATAGRRLKGHAQSRNRGADIFLADPSGNYIGASVTGASVTRGNVCRATLAIAASGLFCTTILMMSRLMRY